MSRPLGIALGVLLAITVVYYGSGWLGGGLSSPDALVDVALSDSDLGARERAALDLIQVGPAAVPHLRRILAESNEPKVQAAAIDGLSTLKDWEGVPALLDAMEHSNSALVRGRASAAVTRMLGADFQYRANGDRRQQAAALAVMRAEYDRMAKNPPPEYRNN